MRAAKRGRFPGASALAAGVAVLGVSATAAEAQARPFPSPAERFALIRPALVKVGHTYPTPAGDAIAWLGTGFLVDSQCLVATAGHIVAESDHQRLVVGLPAPGSAIVETYPARPLELPLEKDVLFLGLVGGPGGTGCQVDSKRTLRLAEASPGETLTGEIVLVAGFPAVEGEQPADVPVVRRGIIASGEFSWGEARMLLLDLTGLPGMSGGPVVLERTGQVVGVVFGPGRTQRSLDLEWATPIRTEDLERARRAWRRARR